MHLSSRSSNPSNSAPVHISETSFDPALVVEAAQIAYGQSETKPTQSHLLALIEYAQINCPVVVANEGVPF